MDGETFDRLSVVVHRLREKATRRGALGLLFGGAVGAAAGLGADDADARRRRRNRNRNRNRHKNCKGAGGRCRSDGDCCSRNCFGNRCFGGGGGGGGGRNCRGLNCPSGTECCRLSSGIRICAQRNHPACFNDGTCPFRWEPCGFNGPVRECCPPETRCCRDDFFGDICLSRSFNCDDFFPDSVRSEGAGEGSEPVPVTEIDPDEFD